jgi:hypothetical protein
MVMPNVVRDARNGYDLRYLIMASIFSGLLFALGFCCVFAGRQLTLGEWKKGSKSAGLGFGFAAAVMWYISMLS